MMPSLARLCNLSLTLSSDAETSPLSSSCCFRRCSRLQLWSADAADCVQAVCCVCDGKTRKHVLIVAHVLSPAHTLQLCVICETTTVHFRCQHVLSCVYGLTIAFVLAQAVAQRRWIATSGVLRDCRDVLATVDPISRCIWSMGLFGLRVLMCAQKSTRTATNCVTEKLHGA